MTIERILAVDDDQMSRALVSEVLAGEGYEVVMAEDGRRAIDLLREQEFDLVISDMRMPGADGIEVVRTAKKLNPDLPVVLSTAFGTIELAVQAMREGAQDFLVKPWQPDQLVMLVQRIEKAGRLSLENRYLREQVLDADGIEFVGEHPAVQELIKTAKTVAKSKATVLIQGESGTGKEVLARLIHRESPRRDRPFVRVNCAALSPTLLESELFGHERGAFTGAVKRREGRFELAHRGTLLLDEISEIAPALQAKLLRVIEEEEFERVGGSRTLRIDVRIIGTTNRDLKAEIRAGRFREDLYYRLQVVPLHVPPLRERVSDLAKLAEYFLAKHSRSNSSRVKGLSAQGREALLRYSWPGNVRELENVVQRSVVLDRHEWITPDDLALPKEDAALNPSVAVGKTVAEMEKELVLRALEHTNHNRSAAAKLLGFTTRTLTNKIRQYRAEGTPVPGGRNRVLARDVEGPVPTTSDPLVSEDRP